MLPRRFIGLLLGLYCAPLFSSLCAQVAPPDSEQVALAKALILAQGTAQTMLKSVSAAFDSQRRQSSDLPAVFFDSAAALARRRVPDLIDSLTPVVAAQYSKEDLRQLVSFFSSPLGQRFASAQGDLAIAAGKLGQRWGMRIGADVVKMLTDAGLDLTQ